MPDKSFEDALADLMDQYADEDPDEMISVLELALMAAKEQHEPEGG